MHYGKRKSRKWGAYRFLHYTQAFSMKPIRLEYHINSEAFIKSGYLPAESARVSSAPCLMTADHTGVSSDGGVVVSMVMTVLVIFNHLCMIR